MGGQIIINHPVLSNLKWLHLNFEKLTLYGLKWLPVDVHPLLRSPSSCTWNPWSPSVKFITVPSIKTVPLTSVKVTCPVTLLPLGFKSTIALLCKQNPITTNSGRISRKKTYRRVRGDDGRRDDKQQSQHVGWNDKVWWSRHGMIKTERYDVCQGYRKWIENSNNGVLCIDGRTFLIAL